MAKKSQQKKTKKKTNNKKDQLTSRQKAFCRYYVETGNGAEAARKAGYSEKTAPWQAPRLLQNIKVKNEITRLMKPVKKKEEAHIASAQEVMRFFTKMMNGEIKDQFGLDASNSDRIKAAQEIAKRTVDVENRQAGKADAVVKIELDWTRDEEEDNG